MLPYFNEKSREPSSPSTPHMAINQEKANAVLQRFRDAQAAEFGMSGERKDRRRPRIVASVTTLTQAEVWRNDVIDELDRKITRIQNCASPADQTVCRTTRSAI